MLDNFGFGGCCSCTVNLGSLCYRICNNILTGTWSHIFLFYLSKSLGSRFKNWVWPRDFQNLDVLCLWWDNNFLSILIFCYIIAAWPWQICLFLRIIFRSSFHASKRHKSLRYFIFVLWIGLICSRPNHILWSAKVSFPLSSADKSHC